MSTLKRLPSVIRSCHGGVLVMAAVVMPVVLILTVMVVDIGRMYVVQSKAQNALDAALLGAVSTISTTDLQQETVQLFNMNFPSDYLQSTVGPVSVTTSASTVYEARVAIDVPSTVIGMFDADFTRINILSQVSGGYEVTQNFRLELALALDNTGSMAGAKIEGLKQASRELTDIIFGGAQTLQNVHVSIIPYDVGVNIGPDRASWIQAPYVAAYNSRLTPTRGFAANRDPIYETLIGCSPNNPTHDDYSPAPPTTEEMRFVSPKEEVCTTRSFPQLPMIEFALNSKAKIYTALDKMVAGGLTRINVGLMWGGFALAPEWQGVWDPARPELPKTPDNLTQKALVLMTDGKNNAWQIDDPATERLCDAIKARGVTVYVIGFGTGADINEPLLRSCASQPSYYWNAPTVDDLRTAFKQIADDVIFSTQRLTR